LKANEEIAFTFFRNNELQDVPVAVATPRSGASRNVAARPAAAASTAAPKTGSNSMSNEDKAAAWDALVWENFGIQYSPIPTQEYKRMYKNFVIISNNPECPNGFPDGGVMITAVRNDSPAERAYFFKGDILVGVKDWSMASADNVRFVGAQEWTKLQSEGDSIRAHVIRNNQHFFTVIPMK
jgi:S1-C subfamily serine protease